MIWTSRLSPSQKYLAATGVTTRDFQLESPNFPDQFYFSNKSTGIHRFDALYVSLGGGCQGASASTSMTDTL